jgi:hypothetical protein
MRWSGHVAGMGDMRNSCKIMVRHYEGNRPLARCRHRWEDNIKLDFKDVLTGFIYLRIGTSGRLL